MDYSWCIASITSPFKGEVRRGMGIFGATINPSPPSLALPSSGTEVPLKGRE